MDCIWWFGEINVISVVLCNKRDPAVKHENLVDKIITTMKHGVGTAMPPHSDILYIIQNICQLKSSSNKMAFLHTVSLPALRVVQHYLNMSNTLVLIAEYVKTNVPIDWMLATHLLGLLHVVQEISPQTLDTILSDAVLSDATCVRFLIENGYTQIVGQFTLAVLKGYTKTVRTMLAHADLGAHDDEAIRGACTYGHTAIVRTLLHSRGVNPSKKNNQAIRDASAKGYTEIVRMLLSRPDVDPRNVNNYAIRFASRNGHTEIVRMLCMHTKVNPSADDDAAIQYASRAGHMDIVRILLWGDEVDPCADDNYAIRKASENGHTDIVQILLACADMDPSVKDNYAIRKARKHGHTEIVQMLLAYD